MNVSFIKRLGMPVTILALFCQSCTSEEMAALPDPPTSAKQVEAFVKGKKYEVLKVGYYGALTVNGKTEMEWIDTTVSDDITTKQVMRDLGQWQLQFINDTAGTVVSKGKPYASKWKTDDQPGEEETPGIRIRSSYTDPDFTFGGSEPMEITFSYVVKGIDETQLLLELPREINRRKLIALLSDRK